MTPVTYMSIEAQMKDISLQNRAATAELEAMLAKGEQLEVEELTSPAPSSRIHWLSLLLGTVLGAGIVALTIHLTGALV